MPLATDIWFRTALRLDELGQQLDLSNQSEDSENYWAWIVGEFHGALLDITRTHTIPAGDTDTRIFRLDERYFNEQLLDHLVSKLHAIGVSPIYSGNWSYTTDDEFEKHIYATHEVD